MDRIHQRTVERDGVRTEIWLERPETWQEARFALETGPVRSTQISEPTDADIDRHRREAAA